MNRDELTIAIASALVLALVAGWTLRWIFGRMNARGPQDVVRTAEMAALLHDAEAAQERAERRLAEAEADLVGRMARLQDDLDRALARAAHAEAHAEDLRTAYRGVLAEMEGRER